MLTPIPDSEKFVKESFKEHYKELLGNDYDEFMKYSLSFIRKSVRVNTLKMPVSKLKKRLESKWELEQVPWCKEGFWLQHKHEKRFDIGNLLEHQLGYIYVQDAASMIPPVVLDPKPGELVLDMCAAPGSKTTQMAAYMKNKGIIVANDNQTDRIKALAINLERCGVTNAVITQMEGNSFRHKNLEFDKVLVDAPCSGTGTIRRSLKVLNMWGPHLVEKMAGIQKHLLETGFKVLKPNGILVYSTCTLEPAENEAVVSFLLDKYENAKLEKINLKIKRSLPVLKHGDLEINPAVKDCLRIHPQDNDSEGFFVAKIRKTP
jgi:NOL1/NOP2/sun family putative RNA methylase